MKKNKGKKLDELSQLLRKGDFPKLDKEKLGSQTIALDEHIKKLGLTDRLIIEAQTEYYRLLYRLREKRRSLHLSQAKLARLSGIPRATISKIETGKRNVTIDTLLRLAQAMDSKLRIDFS